MTTLASAVAIGDTQLIIDAPFAAGQIPGWVKIDDEMLHAGGQHWRTGTTLTLSSPATASHSNGATVTYAGRPYDADFRSATSGGGSGVTVDNTVDLPAEVTTLVMPGAAIVGDEATLLTLQLLGPFVVTKDTPNLMGSGAHLVEIPSGTLVVRAWAECVAVWDGVSPGDDMQIALSGGPGYFVDYDLTSQIVSASGTGGSESPSPTIPQSTTGTRYSSQHRPLRATQTRQLAVFLSASGTPTVGEYHVYALIATPAP